MQPTELDLSAVRDIADGDREFERSFLASLVMNSETLRAELATKCAEEDFAGTSRVAHQLKGLMAIVGATHATEQADGVAHHPPAGAKAMCAAVAQLLGLVAAVEAAVRHLVDDGPRANG